MGGNMKRLWLIILVLAFVSCSKKETEKTSVIKNDTETEKVLVRSPYTVHDPYTGEIFFEIGDLKEEFECDGEVIGMIVFGTSTGDDFIFLLTENSELGVRAEYEWIKLTYPEFSRFGQGKINTGQSLIDIECRGTIHPCDLLTAVNKDTDEIVKKCILIFHPFLRELLKTLVKAARAEVNEKKYI
jgi:hypothetical protein